MERIDPRYHILKEQRRHSQPYEPIQYLIAGGDNANELAHYLAHVFKSRYGVVDLTLSFDHTTGTSLHYLGASGFVSRSHMFPPVDLMVALTDNSLSFENQVIENGTIILDSYGVTTLPKRMDLQRIIVPTERLARDVSESVPEAEAKDLRTAALFGTVLSLHSYFFEPHEALKVFNARGKQALTLLVDATRLGYDWGQDVQLRGPLQIGSMGY